jgi:hypothetical protein
MPIREAIEAAAMGHSGRMQVLDRGVLLGHIG